MGEMGGPPLRTLDSTRTWTDCFRRGASIQEDLGTDCEPGNTPAPASEACLGVTLEGRFHLRPEWTSWPLHIDPTDAGTLCS